jgi:DNA repair protein RAD50
MIFIIELITPVYLLFDNDDNIYNPQTTIIECLKCATTGELPPNCDRGKSFIHDPKVSGDSEVKGQIRLQFKAANKKRYITVRSFQVTQKKKTTQFKQLESVLMTKGDDGESKNNSYKCTDMDKLIPECMGVSKAILENGMSLWNIF